MKKLSLLFIGLVSALSALCQDEPVRDFYERTCSQCHPIDGYVWERSFKEWQACVYSMQIYAGAGGFSDDEADLIIDYLVENGGRIERELLENKEAVQLRTAVPAESVVAVETTAVAAKAPESVQRNVSPARRRAVFAPAARISGYFGVGFLLCGAGSGLMRRRLKKSFRWIHKTAAAGVLTTALLHSFYYLSTHGLPGLLWYQAGVAATGLLLATVLSGLFRRRLRRLFLKTHITGAAICLAAVLIHWVWIYI